MATATKKEAKGTKREKLFRSKVEEGKSYPLDQAVQILKDCATAKFKESIDISVNLPAAPNQPASIVRMVSDVALRNSPNTLDYY